MARARMVHVVSDRAGNVIQNALVNVFLPGTSTPVSDMFAAASGGSAITTLVSNDQGEIEGFFTVPRQVDLQVTDNTDNAYYPSAPNQRITFTPFTETVEVLPAAADFADGGAIGANAKVNVKLSGASVGVRRGINLIPGTDIALNVVDDSGNDEVDVTISAVAGGGSVSHASLTGVTADQHHAENHQSRHQAGGADALAGSLNANARVAVVRDGTLIGTRRRINLIPGSARLSLVVADDSGNEEVDCTFDVVQAQLDHGSISGLGDDDHPQYVRKDTLTTKGDIYVDNGSDPARLAAGADGLPLLTDSAQALGVKWFQVGTAGLADGAVTEDKLGALAVTAGKLGASAVTTAKLANGAVTSDKLASALNTGTGSTTQLDTAANTYATMAEQTGIPAGRYLVIATGGLDVDPGSTTIYTGKFRDVTAGSDINERQVAKIQDQSESTEQTVVQAAIITFTATSTLRWQLQKNSSGTGSQVRGPSMQLIPVGT